MRRRLFFWLDKLKITRTERQAISVLLVTFVTLLLLNGVISPSSPFDDEYYSELDARFQMRTAIMQQEEKQILSRYRAVPASITHTDTLAPDSTTGQVFAAIPAAALVNVNTADASGLQQLRGIGTSYSQRIIEYRRQNGLFQSINELLNIKGIGKVRLQKISPFITLGDIDKIAHGTETEVKDNRSIAEVPDKDKIEADNEVRPKDSAKQENKIGIKATHVRVKAEVGGKTKAKKKNRTQAKDTANVGNENKFKSKRAAIINVNKASAEVLQTLSGIGPSYSRRIVEYRQLNGRFETKEQLLKIKGIGEKRLAKIKPFIKLTDQH